MPSFREGPIRIKILTIGFFVFCLLLIGKLLNWQIIKGKALSQEAKNQYESSEALSAPRGNILAQDGSPLVSRADGYLVFAEIPKLKEKPKVIAEKLAPFFVIDPNDRPALLSEIDRLTELLSKKEVVWVSLKQKIDSQTKKNIEAAQLSGIGFEDQQIRIYPEASTAAHLLGFVGKDEEGNDKGYFGLEGYYDLSLAGRPGFRQGESDARGTPIMLGNSRETLALAGVNLITNIDKRIQMVVESKLKEGIVKYGAKGGVVIVLDPKNGAVLAMSSYPSYDEANYWQYSNELFRNPGVSDAFEPGSVFKIIVMASALDAGVVKPDTICDICDKALKVDKYTIETWNNKYFPDSTMTDVIVHSDNVGMSFVGGKLGSDKLYDYLDKFGIGKPTGIDLQGELSPALRKKSEWNIVDLATASFGQGVAVTPIQMIRAASAIANGGYLITPMVVKSLTGEGWKEDIKPKAGERVISKKAADDMTVMMVEAAKNGEAKWTNARGFSVAGKTGTAQIPIAGHYDAEKTNASFIGFSPANDPKFIMFVSLREPQTSIWASETAAPLWYTIAKELFVYLGIQPEN